MHTETQQAFGRFQRHQLSDPSGRNCLAVSPDGCACLLELRLGGRSLLDAYRTPEELAGNAWFKNVPLFPFPNRLADGAYEWGGQPLQFDLNDAASGNALHGLSRDFKSTVEQIDLHEAGASITCRYQSNGAEPAYPFLYTFEVTYRLKKGDHFEGTLRFRNDHNHNIPVGLGWHPYFQLSERVDDLMLQLPPCELVGVDARMLPTGKRYVYDEFAEPKAMGATILDNCFALSPRAGRAEVTLQTGAGRLHYWQETGRAKFNFLQVFTHPDRQSIAIEPMTCNVDAFHNQEGLIVLQPEEEFQASFGLWWEEK